MCKKEIKSPPEVAAFDRTENRCDNRRHRMFLGVNVDDTPPPPPHFSVPRGLLEIWKMMLEKTDELAKHRLKVAEMMLSQISEEMRQQKRIKEQAFKRVSGGEGRRGGRGREENEGEGREKEDEAGCI